MNEDDQHDGRIVTCSFRVKGKGNEQREREIISIIQEDRQPAANRAAGR